MGPDSDEEPKKSKKELFKSSLRLVKYLRPYWIVAASLLLINLFTIGIGLLRPLLSGMLIDEAILARRESALLLIVGAVLGISVLSAVLSFVYSYFGHRVGQNIVYNLRTDLFEHLQGLAVRFYEDRPTGEIMSRIVNDSEAVEGLIVHAIERLLSAVLTLVGITVYMFVTNARLACLAIIPIPLLIVQIALFSPRFHGIFKRVREMIAALNTFLQERISGVRTVKAFANEQAEAQKFRTTARNCYDAFMRAVINFSIFHPLMGFVSGLGTIVVMFYGGKLAIAGELKPGQLVAFLGYTAMFYSPITELGFMFGHWLPRSLAAGDRIFEFLDEKDILPVPPDAIAPERIDGRIEFRDVWFKYGETDVLKNINLTIEPSETIALVGRSGVGKTTLADLVSRFYDPQQGQVLVDGRDVREYKLNAFRRHIGIVLQEPFLFNTSIRENIAYGKADASDEEISAAARVAGAEEFILALPEKYETIVGERGVKLSVGEKQRVSIARAVVRNPAILVLDEATSSVDTQTERAIQKALERAARGRTTIIIAHRLSTTTIANRVVVLDEGEIAEIGTPSELLERGGIYARLWNMQSTNLIEENDE